MVDTSDYLNLFGENSRHLVLRLPFGSQTYDIYNSIGERISLSSNNNKGFMSFSISIPSIYNANCGWFNRINFIFGEISIEKVWIVLFKNLISVYKSPYGGEESLVNKIECKNISKITNIFYDKNDYQTKSFEIHFQGQESLILTWADESLNLKEFWQRALVHQIIFNFNSD